MSQARDIQLDPELLEKPVEELDEAEKEAILDAAEELDTPFSEWLAEVRHSPSEDEIP